MMTIDNLIFKVSLRSTAPPEWFTRESASKYEVEKTCQVLS
jgi:hypothetical protein